MSRLFGTDGVRGKAGTYPLDAPTVRRLGAALARALALDFALAKGDGRPRFLSGRDTRESGAWIERELAFGINSQDASLTGAGIIPTPAIAYLTPRMGYSAGVVISASHNPFEDNGIKVFSGAGEKSHLAGALPHFLASSPSQCTPGGPSYSSLAAGANPGR